MATYVSKEDTCTCETCPIHGAGNHVYQLVYKAVLDCRLTIREDGSIWRGDRRAELPHHGYPFIRARIKNVNRKTTASRLVWYHFFGRIPKGMQVNHIDGDKTNNNPNNLELVTPSENTKHIYGVLKRGRFAPSSRQRGNDWNRANAHWHAKKKTDG